MLVVAPLAFGDAPAERRTLPKTLRGLAHAVKSLGAVAVPVESVELASALAAHKSASCQRMMASFSHFNLSYILLRKLLNSKHLRPSH